MLSRNYLELSLEMNTTWEFILKYPNYSWNFYNLCNREDFNLKLVCDNPNFPWDWNILSLKYNLSPNILEYIIKTSKNSNNYLKILERIKYGMYHDDKLECYFGY